MKNKVIKLLVKRGNNENDVTVMVAANYDYAVSTYSQAKASFIADVISALQ